MIYDLMPQWLRNLLRMERATLPADDWTWRHSCRYGRDPAKIAIDFAGTILRLKKAAPASEA